MFVNICFHVYYKSRYAHIEVTEDNDVLLGVAEVAHSHVQDNEIERDVEHPYQPILNKNDYEEETVEHQDVYELATCDGLSKEYGCTNVSISHFERKQYNHTKIECF